MILCEDELEYWRAIALWQRDEIILKADAFNQDDEIARLKKRVEELESWHHFHVEGDRQDGLHVITYKQIDRVWEYSRALRVSDECNFILSLFRVVTCPTCDGTTHTFITLDDDAIGCQETKIVCPECSMFTGHGWVVRSHG